MNKHRATFTLDDATETVLRRTAERLGKPKSAVVREAIQDYGARVGRLSEAERLRLLAAFDDLVPKIPSRSLAEVEAELDAIRNARQGGGRRSNGGS
jgi:predicted DNA-binding protein